LSLTSEGQTMSHVTHSVLSDELLTLSVVLVTVTSVATPPSSHDVTVTDLLLSVNRAAPWQPSKCLHTVNTYQRIISNNSYARDEQGGNTKQEKEAASVSSMPVCWHLD